jgi:hypothetical protein
MSCKIGCFLTHIALLFLRRSTPPPHLTSPAQPCIAMSERRKKHRVPLTHEREKDAPTEALPFGEWAICDFMHVLVVILPCEAIRGNASLIAHTCKKRFVFRLSLRFYCQNMGNSARYASQPGSWIGCFQGYLRER